LENRFYPDHAWEYLGTQYYRGYQIALFNLYPYRYNPINRQLWVNENVSLKIISEFFASEAQYQANFLSQSSETQAALYDLTINPEVSTSYQAYSQYRNVQPSSRIIDLSVPKQMIIITDNSRLGWFADYADCGTMKVFPTAFIAQKTYMQPIPATIMPKNCVISSFTPTKPGLPVPNRSNTLFWAGMTR
jgi:hypothetical protein